VTVLDFDMRVPPEVAASARPLFLRWLHLAPTWCHTLVILWDDAPGSSAAGTEAARVTAAPEYRRGTITLCSSWLTEEPGQREEMVRHELQHLVTWPLQQLWTDVSAIVRKGNKELGAALDERWRLALEGCTQDLTRAATLQPADPPATPTQDQVP
jgi:hypothetical protein